MGVSTLPHAASNANELLRHKHHGEKRNSEKGFTMRRRQQTELKSTWPALTRMMALLCCLAMGLTLALVPTTVARAQDASLTLNIKYTSQGKTTPIGGATASLYKVADLNEGINWYTLTPDFASLGVDFNQGLNAADFQTASTRAANLVTAKKLTAVKSSTSDAKGTIAYGTLPYGVYLVMETAATGDAASYNNFTSFLISVPQMTEEGIVYDVMAEPKITPKPVTPTPVKPTTPLAKTGDITDPQLVKTLLATGAMLLLLGIALRHYNRRVRT